MYNQDNLSKQINITNHYYHTSSLKNYTFLMYNILFMLTTNLEHIIPFIWHSKDVLVISVILQFVIVQINLSIAFLQ